MLTHRTERRVLRSLRGYIRRANTEQEYTARQAVQSILADEQTVAMLREEARRVLGAGEKGRSLR